MTIPALFLGFVISTLTGALFHLIVGGKAGKVLLFLILGWVGFWAGHFLAELAGIAVGSIGPLHIAAALAGSLLFLGIGYWLSMVEPNRSS